MRSLAFHVIMSIEIFHFVIVVLSFTQLPNLNSVTIRTNDQQKLLKAT